MKLSLFSLLSFPIAAGAGTMCYLSISDLLRLDAAGLQELFKQNVLNSVELVECCLAQISRENRDGMKLRAMLAVAPRDQLLKEAADLDKERDQGASRSPMHGIPIIIKDSIATDPSLGLPTSAGSHALLRSRPARSASFVDQLRAKGVIILGKTNLTEFCQFKGQNITSGWSAVGGQTRSAYVEGEISLDEGKIGPSLPGGSSTGSAVGVSAGFSPISLGTETDGSLLQPAARAALYALKPSVGIVSSADQWRISSKVDMPGPMAKSVSDLATLLEIILTPGAREDLPPDGYHSFLGSSFKGLKLGFLDPAKWRLPDVLWYPDEASRVELDKAYDAAMAKIENLGATVEYPVDLKHPSNLALDGESALQSVLMYDYRDSINRYLMGLNRSDVRNLDELIIWNKQHADLELPEEFPSQSTLVSALESRPSKEKYERALSHMRQTSRIEGFDRVMAEYNLDIIAMPMDSPISTMAAASGYPLATMPLGILSKRGRPFGLAVAAKLGQESTLIRFMSAYEAAFPPREVPRQLLKRKISGDRSEL